MRWDKNYKGATRFTIADTRGPLRLSVPVSRPEGAHLWNQVLVSPHGRWYHTVPIALESAYGRTPYFEYYIDRFRPVFAMTGRPVTELCAEADRLVRSLLCIPDTDITYATDAAAIPTHSAADYRRRPVPEPAYPPYWQVRAHELGFIPGLSVLDLIFNLGPEADLYLDTL